MAIKETSGVHHWRDSSYRITGIFSFLSLSLSLIKSCLKDATVDRNGSSMRFQICYYLMLIGTIQPCAHFQSFVMSNDHSNFR